jgi:hypothetical protein
MVEWLAQNIFCSNAVWFWVMAQFFVILISLLFIYRQIKVQSLANMLRSLESMNKRWNSDEVVIGRQLISQKYGTDDKSINRYEELVLSFFEELALYVKTGVFDLPTVWELYSYNIEHYCPLTEPLIKEFRSSTNDQTYFSNFEYLYKRIIEHSKKQGAKGEIKSGVDLKKFTQGELQRLIEEK